MRRREFIALVSGVAASWPAASQAQQPAKLPTVGFLGSASPDLYAIRLRAFRQGLKETGYVEGQNVQLEFRWAEGQYDRLPQLAAELAHLQVAVIVAAGGTPAAVATKAETAAIPIVFTVSVDPVAAGLVASLNRPGGNLTGVTNLNVEIGPKRLEVLRELLPAATSIAVLVNPASPSISDAFLRTLHPAARALGLEIHVLQARTHSDLDAAFAGWRQLRADALVIAPDVFFNTHSAEIAALTVRHAAPAIYQFRPFAAAGGLISYGTDETEYYRLAGNYAGKILNGEKPADLPVVQSTKVELIINLKTAKDLGITVPLSLLGRADEVIE